jgi:hypothetical protein
VIWSGNRIRGDRGTLLFGEAYYALSPEAHRMLGTGDRVRHALVLGELKFLDVAVALIQSMDHGHRERRAYHRLVESWRRDRRTWKRRVKDWGKEFYDFVGRLLGD